MRWTALVVLILVASACSGDAVERERATVPTRERLELAVSRSVVGNPPRRDLVLVSATGKTIRELSPNAGGFFGGATWSPDGERVAFTSSVRSTFVREESDIFVVDANGENRRRLTRTGRAFAPVWSPDGRTIVFAERVGEGFPPSVGLWAMDADGANLRSLVEAEPGRVDVPSSFTLDGAELAFTRAHWKEPASGGWLQNTSEIVLFDVDSRNTRKVLDRAADPAISPDGRLLAFVTDRDKNGDLAYGDIVFHANELYVRDLETGDEQRLTRSRNLNERSPSWSSDGELIAYQRGEVTGNAEAASVLTMRADGTCARRIGHDPGKRVWYRVPAFRPGVPRDDTHLRCVGDAHPSLTPLAGNLTLAEARRFRHHRLYWLGRRFEELQLSSIDRHTGTAPGGTGPVVSLHYGTIQLQLYPACVRVPAHVDLTPDKKTRVRGVEAVFFEDGNRMEIVTGKTNIVVFAPARRMSRIARALEPLVARPPKRGAPFPPPEKGAVAGNLAC